MVLVESHQLKHHNKVKFVGVLIVDFEQVDTNPAGNYIFKVINRSTRTRCEICSKSTIKAL